MDLVVEENDRLEISATRPGRYAEAVELLRPRTPDALRRLTGLTGQGERLDREQFTVVPPDEESQPLLLDAGQTGGLSTGLLRALLISAGDVERLPRSVVVAQRRRVRAGCRPAARGDQVVRSVTYRLPDWLTELRLHVPVLTLADIVVGRNATLVLAGPSPVHLFAHNFRIHQGGTVVQTAPHARVDLTGEIQGDLP